MGEVADIELVHPYPVAEFVDAVLAELRAAGHADAHFEPTGFLVRFNGDQRVSVDRLYLELQHMPADTRAAHIRARLDAGLRPLPVSWPEAQPLLRSVLRPASYTAAVTADVNRPWIRPLWPFVHELAVVDTGDARAVVTQRDTDNWGVGGERMFAVARSNIAARYPPQPQQERVGHLRGDGHSYCDSAALVPGWLSSFATDSGPRPLVFFPGDEVLLVCTDDPAVAPEFFAAAERLYRQAVVPVSPQGYTIAGDTIVPLDRGRAGAGAVAGGAGPFGAGRRRIPGADRTPAALLRRGGARRAGRFGAAHRDPAGLLHHDGVGRGVVVVAAGDRLRDVPVRGSIRLLHGAVPGGRRRRRDGGGSGARPGQVRGGGVAG